MILQLSPVLKKSRNTKIKTSNSSNNLVRKFLVVLFIITIIKKDIISLNAITKSSKTSVSFRNFFYKDCS